MPYIQENDRHQWMSCPLDSMVDRESVARLIDRFVDSLDMSKYGFRETALDGRPGYQAISDFRKNNAKDLREVFHEFNTDQRKMAKRMCLPEHPLGTIKMAMGSDRSLLRGLEKVSGEFALMCLGYNFERALRHQTFTEGLMPKETCWDLKK